MAAAGRRDTKVCKRKQEDGGDVTTSPMKIHATASHRLLCQRVSSLSCSFKWCGTLYERVWGWPSNCCC